MAAAELLELLRTRFGGDDASYSGWDAGDFLNGFGSASSALLSAVLLFPAFIEIEGAIFLRDLGPKPERGFAEIADGMRQRRRQPAPALTSYVDSFNWLELAYVFRDHSGSADEYQRLALVVAEAWRTRLTFLYPTRRFVVRVMPPEETGSVTGVGFEQVL